MADKIKLKVLIRERLREMGKSVGWLADQIGRGGPQVSKIARGVTIPGLALAYEIAAALHSTIESLWVIEEE